MKTNENLYAQQEMATATTSSVNPVNEQEVMNDSLSNESLAENIASLHKKIDRDIYLDIFGLILITPITIVGIIYSLYFSLGLLVLILIELGVNVYSKRLLPTQIEPDTDLKAVNTQVQKFITIQKEFFKYSLIVLGVGLTAALIITKAPLHLAISAPIGAIAGLIIAVILYKKLMNQAKTVQENIKTMQ